MKWLALASGVAMLATAFTTRTRRLRAVRLAWLASGTAVIGYAALTDSVNDLVQQWIFGLACVTMVLTVVVQVIHIKPE